jgi:hypothetical protein
MLEISAVGMVYNSLTPAVLGQFEPATAAKLKFAAILYLFFLLLKGSE